MQMVLGPRSAIIYARCPFFSTAAASIRRKPRTPSLRSRMIYLTFDVSPEKRPISLSLHPLSASVSLISARVSIPLLITDNTCALFHQPERKPPCVSWIFIVRAETVWKFALHAFGEETRDSIDVYRFIRIIWFTCLKEEEKGRVSNGVWISQISRVIDEISIWIFLYI